MLPTAKTHSSRKQGEELRQTHLFIILRDPLVDFLFPLTIIQSFAVLKF